MGRSGATGATQRCYHPTSTHPSNPMIRLEIGWKGVRSSTVAPLFGSSVWYPRGRSGVGGTSIPLYCLSCSKTAVLRCYYSASGWPVTTYGIEK